jgi:hypothetical protein
MLGPAKDLPTLLGLTVIWGGGGGVGLLLLDDLYQLAAC